MAFRIVVELIGDKKKMNKEELKKEAEEWIKKNSKEFITNPKCSPFDYAKAIYLAGAEPREKRIADLEATNKNISDECHKLVDSLEKKQNEVAELEAQIEKMKCCGNCKYYKFQNDVKYCTCTKDGKRNGKNYRSCEFITLEKWELRG